MAEYRLNQQGQQVQTAIDKALALGPATSSSAGTMSAADKSKLDSMNPSNYQPVLVSGTNIKTVNNQSILGPGNIDAGSSVTVDSALSSTSTNPVQNRVINAALAGKQATLVGSGAGQNIKTINNQNILGGGNINAAGVTSQSMEGEVDEINLGPNVQYVTQVLSESQKLQARTNIGAASLDSINGKQNTLVSGTNIKTINNQSVLGPGNLDTGSLVTVDASLSSTSENPVQNKVINSALAGKQDTLVGSGTGQNIKTINNQSILGPGNINANSIGAVTVTVDNTSGNPSGTAIVSGSTLSLSFSGLVGATGATGATGPQGPQGNTGSSVDYPYELVNNLTTNDATKGLSAAQGVVLDGKFNQASQDAKLPLLTNVTTPTFSNSAYWQIVSQGVRYTSSGATKCTEPILCQKGTIILTTQAITSATGLSFLTKVSANNDGIESIIPGVTSSKQYYYVMEEECYVSISVGNNNVGFVRIIPSTGLNYLLDYVRDKRDNLLRINANPLEHIIRDCGYGSVIHHWGIVGDSLSSGEIHIRNAGGSNTYIDYYEYSWGQRFAKVICAESCYNFSNGGQTAKGWIEGTVDGSSNIVHGDDYIGGVGGGGWPLAKTAGYKKQAYIIALGVNDHSESYPTGSISTDIGTYDSTTDTDTNADSFVGYYAGIIQRLRSIQPNAKIFCVTMPNNAFPNESAAIADIVEHFHTLYSGGVYLIDFSTYLPIKWSGDYMFNSHGSAQGYQYIAYAVNTYIDWLIRNNADDFKTMPLVTI